MFRLIATATLILSLFSFSSAFAYSTTVTGGGYSYPNGFSSNHLNADFWGFDESGSASASNSGMFSITSDYGRTGAVGLYFNIMSELWANAIGVNPYAETLFDFKITDSTTGEVVFSLYHNPKYQDNSGTWAYSSPLPGLPPFEGDQTLQLDTLYEWTWDIATSAGATGQDDGMGGYSRPDISGHASANFDILITSIDAPPSATPIPGAVWLLGSGLVGLFGMRRKFKA